MPLGELDGMDGHAQQDRMFETGRARKTQEMEVRGESYLSPNSAGGNVYYNGCSMLTVLDIFTDNNNDNNH